MRKYLSLFIISFLSLNLLHAQKKVAVEFGTTWRGTKFEPFDSTYYKYDNNKLVEKIRVLNVANMWRLTGQNTYTHNSDGTVDVESYSVRNPVSNSWELNYKVYHTYNSNRLLEEQEYRNIINGNEEVSTKYKYFYNAQKKLDSMEYYKMDNGSLVREEVTVYDYLSNGNISSKTRYKKSSNWKAADRWMYYYDFSEMLFKEEYEVYNNSSWSPVSYYTYTYDNDGNLRKWVRKSSSGANIGEKYFKYVGEDAFLSTSAPSNNINPKLFPNPFNTKATLQWETGGTYNVEIKDINGRTIKKFANLTSNTLTINSNELKNGFYFYTLYNTQNGAGSTGKFIVNK